jgi:hypothetical protein
MNTTIPITLFGVVDAAPVAGSFLFCGHCQRVPLYNWDTHPVDLGVVQAHQRGYDCSPSRRVSRVQAVIVATLVARRRALADDELSRPLELPDLKMFAMCHDAGHLSMSFRQAVAPTVVVDGGEAAGEEQEAPEQPLEFRWSRTRRKIRAAAKVYSEQTHADLLSPPTPTCHSRRATS